MQHILHTPNTETFAQSIQPLVGAAGGYSQCDPKSQHEKHSIKTHSNNTA